MGVRKTREERLFGAACLKVTLEKGAQGAGGAARSSIYQDTLADLGVSEREVEAYLEENRNAVESAIASKGRPRR